MDDCRLVEILYSQRFCGAQLSTNLRFPLCTDGHVLLFFFEAGDESHEARLEKKSARRPVLGLATHARRST